MPPRWSRLLPFLLIAALPVIAVWLWQPLKDEARLRVENRADQAIVQLEVQVAGRRFDLGRLAPGERREVRLHDYSDSHWSLRGVWADDRLIREDAGYITHGMDFDHRAVFDRDRRLVFSFNPT